MNENDRGRPKQLLLIPIFIFLLLYLFKVIYLQRFLVIDPYVAGDWLINYNAGFVRRGLLGTIMFWIQNIFPIRITLIILAVKVYAYISTTLLLLLVFYKNRTRLTAIDLIFLLSPWAFMFELIYPSTSGRKDILLILAFLIYAIFYPNLRSRKLLGIPLTTALLTFTFLIIGLIHEGMLFFFGFFFVIHVNDDQLSRNEKIWSVTPPTIIMIALLAIILTSGPISVEAANLICDPQKLNLPEFICNGAVMALTEPPFSFDAALYLQKFSIPLIITILPLLAYSYFLNNRDRKITLRTFSFTFIPTLPLYFVAIDWGRWIHIFGMLYFLTTLIDRKPIKLPRFGKWNAFLFILAAFYIFCWQLLLYLPPTLPNANWLSDPSIWLDGLFKLRY